MRVGVATIPIRLRSGQALHCGRHDRRGEGTVMAKKPDVRLRLITRNETSNEA